MTFTDTAALYAVMDRSDDHHEAARGAWEWLLNASTVLVTHNYILIEMIALVQRRLGIPAVRAFEKNIVPVLTVQWIGERHHRTAVEMAITAYRNKLSVVDCASFLIMREHGISEAFTFDTHFSEQGFHTVPS